LPVVDDGPFEMDESIQILKKGVQEGVGTFFLTPHLKEADWDRTEEIMSAFIHLSDECGLRGVNIKLILGSEVYIVPNLYHLIMNHPFATFGGKGKHVLIELPCDYMPIFCEDVFFELLLKGITPIIAHVERYAYLWNDVSRLNKWSESGILFQLNAGSLTGRNGWFMKRRAKKLIKSGRIDFLASDVHRYHPEFSLLSHAFRIVNDILDNSSTEKLKKNPEQLLSVL
jgi:protein-tyrosine phosphatase